MVLDRSVLVRPVLVWTTVVDMVEKGQNRYRVSDQVQSGYRVGSVCCLFLILGLAVHHLLSRLRVSLFELGCLHSDAGQDACKENSVCLLPLQGDLLCAALATASFHASQIHTFAAILVRSGSGDISLQRKHLCAEPCQHAVPLHPRAACLHKSL